MVAIFASFQNAVISRILAVFSSGFFFIEQLECADKVVLGMFMAFFIFEPNRPACKGYSLCVVAIFAIFKIL